MDEKTMAAKRIKENNNENNEDGLERNKNFRKTINILKTKERGNGGGLKEHEKRKMRKINQKKKENRGKERKNSPK